MSRANKHWTPIEDELLRQLYEARVPGKEIAAQLCRTEYAIHCRRQILGIYYKPKEDARSLELRMRARGLRLKKAGLK